MCLSAQSHSPRKFRNAAVAFPSGSESAIDCAPFDCAPFDKLRAGRAGRANSRINDISPWPFASIPQTRPGRLNRPDKPHRDESRIPSGTLHVYLKSRRAIARSAHFFR